MTNIHMQYTYLVKADFFCDILYHYIKTLFSRYGGAWQIWCYGKTQAHTFLFHQQ